MILPTWARTEGTKARTETAMINTTNTADVTPFLKLKREWGYLWSVIGARRFGQVDEAGVPSVSLICKRSQACGEGVAWSA
jgi:hypothetical protein